LKKFFLFKKLPTTEENNKKQIEINGADAKKNRLILKLILPIFK